MRPLLSDLQDSEALQNVGRASIQIVHDLKNQLNGLKLYATFLRKRMEKSERPADELETISKLIAGLERAATDMTALVNYGRPLELRRQGRVDLGKILSRIIAEGDDDRLQFEPEAEAVEGDFDVAALTDALKSITTIALNLRSNESAGRLKIFLRRAESEKVEAALIEWKGVSIIDGTDPFHSFAGSNALRMLLAAKIIEAHGGETAHAADTLRVRLPLRNDAG